MLRRKAACASGRDQTHLGLVGIKRSLSKEPRKLVHPITRSIVPLGLMAWVDVSVGEPIRICDNSMLTTRTEFSIGTAFQRRTAAARRPRKTFLDRPLVTRAIATSEVIDSLRRDGRAKVLGRVPLPKSA